MYSVVYSRLLATGSRIILLARMTSEQLLELLSAQLKKECRYKYIILSVTYVGEK